MLKLSSKKSSMKQKSFSIHGFFNFTLTGKGNLFNYFSYQYDFFKINSTENKVFQINVVDKLKFNQSKKLSDGKEEFHRDGDCFIYKLQGASMRIEGKKELKQQKLIEIEAAFSKMKANTILDLFFRFFTIKDETQLIHAACVDFEGKGILIPAWKGMGKTNSCLEFVKKGYNFLGDDKVWLTSEGDVYSYPRYVVIKGEDNFEFISLLNVKNKFKLVLRYFLTKVFNINKRPIAILINLLVKPVVNYFRISELFPGTKTMNSTKLNDVLFLSKDCSVQQFDKKSMSSFAVSQCLSNIANAEWNLELLKITSAHDILFPDGISWTKELETLFKIEEINISKGLSFVDCNEVIVPENKKHLNWNDFFPEINRK